MKTVQKRKEHSRDDESSSEVRLKRRFGLIHGIAVICGVIIGVGIYISPKGVLVRVGSPGLALVLWGFCGCFAMIGGLTWAEVGTTFPRSGEMYHYLDQMYGPFPAFLYLWCYLFLMRPGANAIKLLTFANYTLQLVYADCEPPDTPVVLLAVLLSCLLTFVNVVRVKWSARLQTLASGISLAALTLIGITGIAYMGMGHVEHLTNGFRGSSNDPGDIVLAIYSCVYALSGWTGLNFMIEELKNPHRTLPLAIAISVCSVTVLYMLVNTAYIAVLGTEASDAVAASFTRQIFGSAAFIMPVLVALNTAGSFNSGTLVASRICFVGGRSEHLPEFLSYISVRFLSPVTALIFQCFLNIIMVAFLDIFSLLNNSVFATAIFEALTVAGIVRLRYKQPDLHRPLKMPIVLLVVFLIFDVIMVAIPLITKPKEAAMGMLLIVCSGVPYYVIFVLWKNKPSVNQRWVARINHFIQKLLLCVSQSGSPDF